MSLLLTALTWSRLAVTVLCQPDFLDFSSSSFFFFRGVGVLGGGVGVGGGVVVCFVVVC